jgi:Cu(I)/Ag(I) efflux system protein CusF
MKYLMTTTLLLLAVSGTAMAQETAMDPAMQNMQSMLGTQSNTGVGTVNRVDLQNGKVNLTHGPIKSLGWPGMTMDFTVRDKTLLNGIKSGEKVEFNVVKEGPGQFYIDRIAPVK